MSWIAATKSMNFPLISVASIGSSRTLALFAIAFSLIGLSCATTREPQPGVLRVGTSGDYAPFSVEARDGSRSGFDVELARRYARDRGLEIEWVSFRWAELERDLLAGRFDVAISGVTVGPARSLVGRFTVPVVQSGAVVLSNRPVRHLGELDRKRFKIGVNAGGHLERVTRARIRDAQIVAITPNAAVRDALLVGEVDAVVTDTFEAPHWSRGQPELVRIGPLTRDRKAWLVSPDQAELARDLDLWLLAKEQSGDLEGLRTGALGVSGDRSASLPSALLAAIDERLALMPWVAAAKQRDGLPLEAPEREALVLASAWEATRAAAARAGREPPSESAVRALFRAQIDAAKGVQRRAIEAKGLDPDPPDLESELRPAILRLGDRISFLAVRLPAVSESEVRRQSERQLSGRLLANERKAIADAIVSLGRAAQ